MPKGQVDPQWNSFMITIDPGLEEWAKGRTSVEGTLPRREPQRERPFVCVKCEVALRCEVDADGNADGGLEERETGAETGGWASPCLHGTLETRRNTSRQQAAGGGHESSALAREPAAPRAQAPRRAPA